VFEFFGWCLEFRLATRAKPIAQTHMQTKKQGDDSMKPELLTKRDTAITTHEENVRARAYELYEMRGSIDGHAEED
jgi:hypothetical protein